MIDSDNTAVVQQCRYYRVEEVYSSKNGTIHPNRHITKIEKVIDGISGITFMILKQRS